MVSAIAIHQEINRAISLNPSRTIFISRTFKGNELYIHIAVYAYADTNNYLLM